MAVECPVTFPAAITLHSLVVGLWWSNAKFLKSHLNSLESQKIKTRKKTRKPENITEEIREKEAEKIVLTPKTFRQTKLICSSIV